MTLVFASVGTDHHPFDRLIDYLDSWHEDSPDVDLVVQHGTSRASRSGHNHPLLPHAQMLEQFAAASVLVTQVGPGTILDANSLGRRPIVIPRDPRLGEHVDHHQLRFGVMMHDLGQAVLVQTQEELRAALGRALADPEWTRVEPRKSPRVETARRLSEEVARVLGQPVSRLPSWSKVMEMLRRPMA